jgi:hypothetical protein
MKKKSFLKRVGLALKKAYLTPTLPQFVLDLQLHPLVRIFRVCSGISFTLVFLKRSDSYSNNYVFYIAFFFVICFFIYQLYMLYYRLKHMKQLLKSNELEIRNSPLDRLASIGTKILFCIKGSCEVLGPVGTALTVMFGADQILTDSQREPIFRPYFVKFLDTVFPKEGNNLPSGTENPIGENTSANKDSSNNSSSTSQSNSNSQISSNNPIPNTNFSTSSSSIFQPQSNTSSEIYKDSLKWISKNYSNQELSDLQSKSLLDRHAMFNKSKYQITLTTEEIKEFANGLPQIQNELLDRDKYTAFSKTLSKGFKQIKDN